MSAWHREHPELAGTDADPWMANPAHARAAREVAGMQAMARADMTDEIPHVEYGVEYECARCAAGPFHKWDCDGMHAPLLMTDDERGSIMSGCPDCDEDLTVPGTLKVRS